MGRIIHHGLRGCFSQMTQLEAPKKRNAHQTAAKNHLHCSKCKTKVSSEGLAPVLWLRSLGKKASKTSGLLKGWVPQVLLVRQDGGEQKHDGKKIIETHSVQIRNLPYSSNYGYVSLGIRGSSLQDWTKTGSVMCQVHYGLLQYFFYIIT